MTADYQEALAATRRVAGEHADETDRAARFPVEALSEMRRHGLLGLLVPVEYGGRGGGLRDLADATLELGRADLSVALIFAMHCQQVQVINRYGCPDLRAAVLSDVAEGKLYLASVTTDRRTGGKLLEAGAPSEQLSHDLWFDRDAPIVTGGAHADGFLITVQTPGAATVSDVSLVYAARDQVEVEIKGTWDPLGMRATESVPLRLTGTVPESQLIGRAGQFRSISATLLAPVAHIGWSAAWLGTATGAFSRVVSHLRGRSGRADADPKSELLLTRLAWTRERLDSVNALLCHTVTVVESNDLISSPQIQLLINTLKIQAAEQCYSAVNELVEVMGLRHGYLGGSPLGLDRALRDLRSAALNISNDRLRLVDGALALMDSAVRLA